MLKQSPLPLSYHIAIGVVGSLISAICGYGVLKGMNWSRLLYLGWTVLTTIFNLGTMPVTSIAILGIVLQLVLIFLLFRPAANAWFRQDSVVGA
jgi:hypothetical protein